MRYTEIYKLLSDQNRDVSECLRQIDTLESVNFWDRVKFFFIGAGTGVGAGGIALLIILLLHGGGGN